MTTEIERWRVQRAQQMPHRGHAALRNARDAWHIFPHLEDSRLSFPGYLGADYRRGEGVLIVANVHRKFDSGGITGDPGGLMKTMVVSTMDLQYGASADVDDYLAATRKAYEAGLGPSGWTVGAHINAVFDAALIDDTRGRRRMVYMNVSCGQFPERTPGEAYPITDEDAGNAKTRMQTCCNQAHSVSTAVAELRPAVVLCMSWRVDDALRRSGWSSRVPVIYFHQWASRRLRLLRPVTLAGARCEIGEVPGRWLPLLTAHLRDFSLSRADPSSLSRVRGLVPERRA